eukprot:5665872-Pyramimonas_sp.AAC.1
MRGLPTTGLTTMYDGASTTSLYQQQCSTTPPNAWCPGGRARGYSTHGVRRLWATTLSRCRSTARMSTCAGNRDASNPTWRPATPCYCTDTSGKSSSDGWRTTLSSR